MTDLFNYEENLSDINLKSAKIAVDWLLNSKIHNTDRNKPETFGSFNAYYDLFFNKYKFAYTEITSYGVELLLDFHELTNNPHYLEDAKASGDWILKMQYKGEDPKADGSFSFGYPLSHGPKSSKAYAFDAGICIGALVELYKKTGIKKYLEAAIKGADWLFTLKTGDGHLKPLYDERNKFYQGKNKWYLPHNLRVRRDWFEKPGCHHGKVVIGLLKLHSVTQDDNLEVFAKELCRWTISQQGESGYFKVNPESQSVFTHTHCYAIEGLLYAYGYLGNQGFLKSALKGVSWLIQIQKAYNVIPDWVHDGKINRSTDSSSIAQFARILFSIDAIDEGEAYQDIYEKVIKSLLEMQCSDTEDLDKLGGFYLFKKDFKLFKFKFPRLYSWPTMFAINTLTLPYYAERPTLLDLW